MSEETRSGRPSAVLLLATVTAFVPGCGSEEGAWRQLEQLPFDEGTVAFEWMPDAGAGRLRIRHADGRVERVVYEGRIVNDGGSITLDNLRPRTDRPPELVLCLNGSGQEDVIVRINVRTGTAIELERRCAE